jgi:hypothetical protein
MFPKMNQSEQAYTLKYLVTQTRMSYQLSPWKNAFAASSKGFQRPVKRNAHSKGK